ncbi:LuxR C-terminal-related transcriptional regulator [Muricauda sp. 334s03]|uniref:LuxR C-terminal-related transcriptional regulator n=1 Tax=Flagellimonas yonaguniensis TaxID=3031325 RepID=A0ABT5Y1J1_9FLAO|nr:LuxR C-terminal-related transcriptional regulator [[Muricauda] yonaguniensis]MDF0717309.1 LuxR C-terminal-related transcriptional regulator [[Muricauda] yonaguniensis]
MAFVLLFFQFIGMAQENTGHIDSLLTVEFNALRQRGEFEKAANLCVDQIKASREIGYDQGVAKGYKQISIALTALGQYQESLRYLALAQNMAITSKNHDLRVRVLSGVANNYLELKLNQKAIEKYDEAILQYKKYRLDNDKLLCVMYMNKSASFAPINIDSVLIYRHKAIKSNPTNPNPYINLAYFYMFKGNNLDSTEHYLKKVQNVMALNPPTKYQESVFLMTYGDFHKKKGDYKAALNYYGQALEISKVIKRVREIGLLYNSISETYDLMGDSEKSSEFHQNYLEVNNSISEEKNRALNLALEQLLEEQESEYRMERRQFLFLITTGIVVLLVLIYLLYRYFDKKRKQKLIEKDLAIRLKEQESNALRERLNDAFNEIVALASENSPFFLARFQEVYPEVFQKLLKINPNLVNTELKLCAMIWFNFSSKEIARFTFVQPKTVQVKKYRLRKKLGIPKSEDLYHWMSSL